MSYTRVERNQLTRASIKHGIHNVCITTSKCKLIDGISTIRRPPTEEIKSNKLGCVTYFVYGRSQKDKLNRTTEYRFYEQIFDRNISDNCIKMFNFSSPQCSTIQSLPLRTQVTKV